MQNLSTMSLETTVWIIIVRVNFIKIAHTNIVYAYYNNYILWHQSTYKHTVQKVNSIILTLEISELFLFPMLGKYDTF